MKMTRDEGGIVGGHLIPRGATVFSEEVRGESCQFTTCYPVELWPIEVTAADLLQPPFKVPELPVIGSTRSVLRIRFETTSEDFSFDDLKLESLRLFLNGDGPVVQPLYEMFFNNAVGAAVVAEGGQAEYWQLPIDRIQQVGFSDSELMLPDLDRIPHAHRLLADYFAFAEKFLFVDLLLDSVKVGLIGNSFELLIYINRDFEELERHISAQNIVLGAVPAVNLFKQTAEPISLVETQPDYLVVPDSNREFAREVHSIRSVSLTDENGETTQVPPLYSLDHTLEPNSLLYWVSSRHENLDSHSRSESTDVQISLVHLDLTPTQVDAESTLTVETLCTNRQLVGELPFGGGHPFFRLEHGGPVDQIECLVPPTPTRRPELGRTALWRVISQLSLNFLPISGDDGAQTLRELLRTYDHREEFEEAFPFDGILDVSCRPTVRRLPPNVGSDGVDVDATNVVFAQGLAIELLIDEDRFVGVGYYMLACILEQYFALFVYANSFTSLTLVTKQRSKIQTWPPRSSTKQLI